MKKYATFILKFALFVIGCIVIGLCIWMVHVAAETAATYPEFAYLQYPVLIYLYITTVPFFYALYQAYTMIRYMDVGEAFSDQTIDRLRTIKYCAVIISVLYVIGSILLTLQSAMHPGIALASITIVFASVVIAYFATLLQELLARAISIKKENECTV
ncbi:hypothetical protein J416_14962 [Gracilibacillus halophilus YIM-C55.5]|uniref:YoaS protein n=1 Tax=Gracilibacillus halophilus YIM-C55.5 TaxID=1308866 RepID=N4WHI3_9BACI|nr:DUF2975 domain-containing protein [Gracilibacillus halophilus]ENH95642.1 hypothetical protein J416_14962 [Gracilibacillus halophilus YIM-C55.5]